MVQYCITTSKLSDLQQQILISLLILYVGESKSAYESDLGYKSDSSLLYCLLILDLRLRIHLMSETCSYKRGHREQGIWWKLAVLLKDCAQKGHGQEPKSVGRRKYTSL